jgi:hypothetical protein
MSGLQALMASIGLAFFVQSLVNGHAFFNLVLVRTVIDVALLSAPDTNSLTSGKDVSPFHALTATCLGRKFCSKGHLRSRGRLNRDHWGRRWIAGSVRLGFQSGQAGTHHGPGSVELISLNLGDETGVPVVLGGSPEFTERASSASPWYWESVRTGGGLRTGGGSA